MLRPRLQQQPNQHTSWRVSLQKIGLRGSFVQARRYWRPGNNSNRLLINVQNPASPDRPRKVSRLDNLGTPRSQHSVIGATAGPLRPGFLSIAGVDPVSTSIAEDLSYLKAFPVLQDTKCNKQRSFGPHKRATIKDMTQHQILLPALTASKLHWDSYPIMFSLRRHRQRARPSFRITSST